MDKLDPKHDGASPDIVQDNIDKLRELFPDAFTEGSDQDGPRSKVDFDALRQILGDYVEDERERYSFTWHGKARARKIAQTPSAGTLRPCPEESVNWDTTQNLFIEGDNLEVLKLLQKSYHKQVKMIYIDPPYNTGKDFIYPDRYADNLATYLRYTNQVDGDGLALSPNSETSGRYHTNWLNMMYPRLKIARNLLTEDGIVFISIDDHEVNNLRFICDEIFGMENLVAQFTWRTDGNFDNQARVKNCHEYILMYARKQENIPSPPVVDPNIPEESKLYKDKIRNTIVKNGPRNPPSKVELPKGFPAAFDDGFIARREDRWPIYESDAIVRGAVLEAPVQVRSGWSSRELLDEFIRNGCEPVIDGKGQETYFEISSSGAIEVVKKRSNEQSHVISVIEGLGGSQKANSELDDLGLVFDDYPKPSKLIKYLIKMNYGSDFYVLDFFAGSCSTAHAVMEANREDGGHRKFIMCQLPYRCGRGTRAYNAGFETISEIGKERIRRVFDVNKGMNGEEGPSSGFKSLKLDASNIRPWDPNADELRASLFDAIDNIKPGRSEQDVLYELLLKYGLDLAVPIEERDINGRTVFVIGAGALIVCLADDVNLDVVKGIAALKEELTPEVMRVVFKDAGFADDVVKTNTVQILRQADVEDVKSL